LPFLPRPTTTANNILEMKTEQTFPTEINSHERNLDHIIIAAQDLRSSLRQYWDIEGELGSLMLTMKEDNIRDIRVDVLKWYRALALNNIAQMENEIATLKKQFEAWL
jgi:hypothetical protein|tara:strand:+ start:206 stop:529 length:324 start_codon:yes stop_codon:yes gene_type:complete